MAAMWKSRRVRVGGAIVIVAAGLVAAGAATQGRATVTFAPPATAEALATRGVTSEAARATTSARTDDRRFTDLSSHPATPSSR